MAEKRPKIGQNDLIKFDRAKELNKHLEKIRSDYTRDLSDKLKPVRRCATALYFIDKLALRAGNKKTDKKADTVGCCSLRCEHITLVPPRTVEFDFLGKNSVRYVNSVEVIDQVFKNLGIFMKNKESSEELFDRLMAQDLNEHLSEYMKGLTIKVFCTYNASCTFQIELKKGMENATTIREKIVAYNKANRQVAILCNHQHSVSKDHDNNQINKIDNKVHALKYQRNRCEMELLNLVPRLKKSKPQLFEPELDMEEEWIIEHEKQLMEGECLAAVKKFERDNEKLTGEGKSPKPDENLKQLLKNIDEKEKVLKNE
nr:5878_t:CDS:2 [Entrophospora candida]